MGIISLRPAEAGLTTGYADRFDPGTALARPGGVENVLEYNGALLNVRGWYDTFLINSIDGLADIDLRDVRENNPGRHGETTFNALYGGRTITLTGKIRAFSLNKLRDMQMGLKQIFGDINKELPLYFRTTSSARDVFIMCKKSAPILMGETQTNFEYSRDFQVTLRASNPFFLSYLGEQILLNPASGTLTAQADVINLGNAPAYPSFRIIGPSNAAGTAGLAMTIEVTSTDSEGSTVVQETSINAKAGSSSAVASGRHIAIDTEKRTIKEFMTDGTLVGSVYSQFNIDSEWPTLAPGMNTVAITKGASGATQVQVNFRSTFL